MTILRRQAAWLGLVAFLVAGDDSSATTVTLSDALPLERITFITISKISFRAEEETWTVKCEDQDLIKKLVMVFQGGQPSQDHKCSNIGTITIHFKNGKKLELGILPGHDETLYQFRLHADGEYDIFQVGRPEFLNALEAVGCPMNDAGFPR